MENEVTMIAKHSVIGAIIIEEKSLSLVIDITQPEDFYFPEFKETYKSILELSSQAKAIDFVTVLNQVTANGNYSRGEMKKLLLQCAETTPSISNVEHYAEIVASSHKSRRLQEIGNKLAFDGITAENVNEVADEVMENLYEIISDKHKKRLQSVENVGLQVLESYKNTNKDLDNRSQTGSPKLDETLKGMSAGNLIILAARPKVGKTAFALSVARNVATTGKTVVFYSMEMESSEIYERLLSNISKIPMNTLIDRRFNDKKRPQTIVKEFKSGTISLGVDNIGVTAAQDLTGAKIDNNHVIVSTSDDSCKAVAIGFRAKKSNGKYRHYWLYRVKFGIPGASLQTKDDSIIFSTPTIEGTVMRRNKVDGLNNHPWKSEVNEDDSSVLSITLGLTYIHLSKSF